MRTSCPVKSFVQRDQRQENGSLKLILRNFFCFQELGFKILSVYHSDLIFLVRVASFQFAVTMENTSFSSIGSAILL